MRYPFEERKEALAKAFAEEWKVREEDVADYLEDTDDRNYLETVILQSGDFEAWQRERGVTDAPRSFYYRQMTRALDRALRELWDDYRAFLLEERYKDAEDEK